MSADLATGALPRDGGDDRIAAHAPPDGLLSNACAGEAARCQSDDGTRGGHHLQHADIWHIFADPATLRHKISVLRQHCADVGRDPAEIELCAGTEDPGARPEELGAGLRGEGASLFTVNSSGPG